MNWPYYYSNVHAALTPTPWGNHWYTIGSTESTTRILQDFKNESKSYTYTDCIFSVTRFLFLFQGCRCHTLLRKPSHHKVKENIFWTFKTIFVGKTQFVCHCCRKRTPVKQHLYINLINVLSCIKIPQYAQANINAYTLRKVRPSKHTPQYWC